MIKLYFSITLNMGLVMIQPMAMLFLKNLENSSPLSVSSGQFFIIYKHTLNIIYHFVVLETINHSNIYKKEWYRKSYRFLLQVIGKCSERLDHETSQLSPGNLAGTDHGSKHRFLLQQTHHLLLYITHMFQSGG